MQITVETTQWSWDLVLSPQSAWVLRTGSGTRKPVRKAQPCYSPASVTIPTENILKRDTCDLPFGHQTTVPKELEFPQESHAGSRKRQKTSVSKRENRDFTLL